jgi:hypothetical protein
MHTRTRGWTYDIITGWLAGSIPAGLAVELIAPNNPTATTIAALTGTTLGITTQRWRRRHDN